MILASIDWLTISIRLLLIIFVLGALLMSLLILMQRPKQEGLGAAFGSGMTDQMFGARTTNVLQKGTVYLGSLFFILTLTLAILFARKNEREDRNSMVKKDVPAEEQTVQPVEETPATGGGETESTPSLEESLEGQLDPATGGETPAGETGDEGAETPADAGDGAAEEASTEETPAEGTPVEGTPAEGTSTEETPAEQP